MQNKFTENIDTCDEKDKRIKELEEKLRETEIRLSELGKEVEGKVVTQTVEINKLVKQKSRFIDNLSHDLATPITPLISLLPIIKEEIEDPKSKELLDTCIRNVEYIKRVINNARELADIGSTDFVFKREKLHEIVEELAKRYDVVFKSYNVKVENNIETNVTIKAEKNRLLQLFDHVTSNAINSMTNGGTLKFESKPFKRAEKKFVQITVTDTGAGLTRDQTDRLFDEFYKTDDSRHKLDSTGLGLAICKLIVEKHGGKIWADSHGPGTGASIHFTIPSEESVYDRSF